MPEPAPAAAPASAPPAAPAPGKVVPVVPAPGQPVTPPPPAAAPAAPPAAAPKDWREHLDPSIASDSTLADFKDPGEVVKSYVHLRKMIGRDKVPVPSDDAPQEQWDAFYERTGRPKEAKGYELKKPADLPDWYQYRGETESAFADIAHKNGLNKKQAQEVWGWLNTHAKSSMSGVVQANEERLTSEWESLRSEWGSAYEANVKAAQAVVLKAGGEEFAAWVKKTGLAREPMATRFLANLASKVLEGDLKDSKGQVVMAPAQARAKIAKVMEDPTHPYHQGKPSSIEEMQNLFALAYPKEKG